MINKATKKEAVKLISDAVKAGFSRSVTSYPWFVQVALFDKGQCDKAARQILVTFSRVCSGRKRQSVSIRSQRIHGFAGESVKLRAGLWNARHMLSNP